MAKTYTLSIDEYVGANRRHCSLLYRSWRGWMMPLIGGAIWAFLLVIDRDGATEETVGVFALMTLVFAGAIWLLVVGINALWIPRRARKLYRQSRAMHGAFVLKWDVATIQWESERGQQSVPWSDFVKWAKWGDGLMLYANDALFYALPDAALSRSEHNAICRQLIDHGVPEWRAWRRLPQAHA